MSDTKALRVARATSSTEMKRSTAVEAVSLELSLRSFPPSSKMRSRVSNWCCRPLTLAPFFSKLLGDGEHDSLSHWNIHRICSVRRRDRFWSHRALDAAIRAGIKGLAIDGDACSACNGAICLEGAR